MKSLDIYQEFIVFDCETTGLDPFKNHVIELACCKFKNENNNYILIDKIDVLIKIDYPLPSNIINLTGITDDMLLNQGISELDAAKEFYNRFISNSDNKKLFIAYNAPFDINFISQMLKRNGYSFPNNSDYLDVMTVFKDRASYPHRLVNAIENYHLSEKFSNSHRAIDDCLACFEVLLSMGKEYDDIVNYVNLFGFNPKYPVINRVSGVRYCPQYYGSTAKLYKR